VNKNQHFLKVISQYTQIINLLAANDFAIEQWLFKTINFTDQFGLQWFSTAQNCLPLGEMW
jgi:hypothetical protein